MKNKMLPVFGAGAAQRASAVVPLVLEVAVMEPCSAPSPPAAPRRCVLRSADVADAILRANLLRFNVVEA